MTHKLAGIALALGGDTEPELEVLAREMSGNRTITAVAFRTKRG
jgi:hypothetical protein